MIMIKHFLLVLPLVCFSAVTLVADDEAAEKVEKADEKAEKLKAGPDDPREVAKPGKIDKDASAEFKTTDSGLKYRILRASKKPRPTRRSVVTVHYKGWTDDGKIFDSSYRRGNRATFPLGGVIPGWTEGMQLIGNGGMIELEIPSALGYGPRGVPGTIPPNATLHFVVELFGVK